MFTVDEPAADRSLLTLAEIKAAVGETTSDNDAALTDLALQISDVVSNICTVQSDGINPATLLSETLTETIRVRDTREALTLVRRFVTEIASVTIDGDEVDTTLYELDAPAGILYYLTSTDDRAVWPCGKIVVEYTAGFATIPTPLKLAAKALARDAWSAEGRDSLLRGETHEGLGSFQYFQSSSPYGSGSGSGVPQTVLDMLAPYRSYHQ